MPFSLDPGLIWTILNAGLVALICGVFGCAIMAIGFARRGHSARSGGIAGLLLGASIGLMILGALGIIANSTPERLTHRMISIADVGVGLAFLFSLRVFGPRQCSPEAQATGEFSQLNIPIPKALRKPKAEAKPGEARTFFLSYRREDSADTTGRIYDNLVQRYGKASIFKDVDSIPFGVDFRSHMQTVLGSCDVVLVIIGDHWLNAADSEGAHRLDDPADFVRVEVETALQRSIPVVPVLVHGASMPKMQELPEPMQPLAYRNGLAVRHDPDFHNDMDRLIKSMGKD
jgi:TIR domain